VVHAIPGLSAFPSDLERWLAGEPIRARPAGVSERALKWARRRPAVAVLLFLVLLALGAVFGLAVAFTAELQDSNEQLSRREAALNATNEELDKAVKKEEAAAAAAFQQAGEARRFAGQEAEQRRRAESEREKADRLLMSIQLNRVDGLYRRDPEQARELLEDPAFCPLDRRGAAWRWYHSQCDRECEVLGESELHSGTHAPQPGLTLAHSGDLLLYGLGYARFSARNAFKRTEGFSFFKLPPTGQGRVIACPVGERIVVVAGKAYLQSFSAKTGELIGEPLLLASP